MSTSKYVYVHLTYPIEIFENGEYKEINNCSNIEFEECSRLSKSNITNYEIHERLTKYIKNTFGSNKIKFEKEYEDEDDNDENTSIGSSNDSVFSNDDDSVLSDKSTNENVPNNPQTECKLIVNKNEIKPKIYSLNKTFKNKKRISNNFSRKQIV